MGGAVPHARLVRHDGRDAVAVVHVPVEDRNSPRRKPIGVSRVAWCPGGRASASAGPSPRAASEAASSQALVPSIIAFHEPGAQNVSASKPPPPRAAVA
eukprot:scaffold5143_cov119-Isochrysis_galbana.AAC.28